MINPLLKFTARHERSRPGFMPDERGVTAIEFGLLAFPFFTIIAGILQTSVVFLAMQVMESAVNETARLIRTGQMQESGTMETFRTDVCDRLYGLFADCNGLHIRVEQITNFQSANVTVPVDVTCAADCDWTEEESWTAGNARTIMLVQVYYRYPVLLQFGPLGMANLADGSRLMGTATVFQNEPFPS